jgi:hypothetical protein
MQQLRRDDGMVVDLAAIDILRSRERGVPRYNEFRRLLRLPEDRSFDDLTQDPQAAAELATVYDSIEDVDLTVGLNAEPPPPGFGFGDTAFRIFILMASRRLFAGLEGLLDLNAAVALGAADSEPVHDIARVVAVEVIAPRGNIDRDPRAISGAFDGVLDFLFQIDVGAGDMPAARGTTSVVVPALAPP